MARIVRYNKAGHVSTIGAARGAPDYLERVWDPHRKHAANVSFRLGDHRVELRYEELEALLAYAREKPPK